VLVDFFEAMGVEYAFGVIGGPIAHVTMTMTESKIQVMHFKHETGAAFAAIEASLASQRPVVLFVTTGPGITNALTGIISARSEGASVIVISGYSPPKHRGRYVSQDTSSRTFSQSIFSSPAIFDYSCVVDHEEDLELAMVRIEQGCQKPSGFVAHLAIPANMQNAPMKHLAYDATRQMPAPECSKNLVNRCLDILGNSPFVIWAGFGARHAWQEVRTLVEVTNATLMCTPRSKGIIPDNHPNFLGMTGLGSDPEVEKYFSKHHVEHLLVLGSRLGEGSSFWSNSLLPRKSIIHVDLNPQAMLAAYPHVQTLGIQSEIGAFIKVFLEEWRERGLHRLRDLHLTKSQDVADDAREGPVRPSFLMSAVQNEIVDKSDDIVLVDVGNAFSFSNRYLKFSQPNRYRVHFDFGSMGCASAGVLGAALGSGKRAVAIVGDGALLMTNEINTAVRYQIPCLWIVLNDARYGMVVQGLEAMYGEGREGDFPSCTFADIARAMGAEGVRVESETAMHAALKDAAHRKGPFVIDVQIDKSEKAPSGQRFVSLANQRRHS
jgi:acetolactate synthase-1/2/3 large subunit